MHGVHKIWDHLRCKYDKNYMVMVNITNQGLILNNIRIIAQNEEKKFREMCIS